jgi:hypothetical protein
MAHSNIEGWPDLSSSLCGAALDQPQVTGPLVKYTYTDDLRGLRICYAASLPYSAHASFRACLYPHVFDQLL